jgi:hypothetical protein
MATELIGLPSELFEKVKESAAKEEITPEELVRDAVENRLSRLSGARRSTAGSATRASAA